MVVSTSIKIDKAISRLGANILNQSVTLTYDIGVSKSQYFRPEPKSKGFKTIAGAGGQRFRRTSRKRVKQKNLNIPQLLEREGYEFILKPLRAKAPELINAIDVIKAFYSKDQTANKRIENLLKGAIRQFMLNNNYQLKEATIRQKGFRQATVDTGQTLQNIFVKRRQ